MKSVNFIKNTDPDKHLFIRRWMCCSAVILVITCIALATLSIRQYQTYNTTQHDYVRLQTSRQQLQAVLQEKRTLKEKIDFLQKQCSKITKIKERPTNPAQVLKLFTAQTEPSVILDDLQINKKDVSITLSGSSTAGILQYIHELCQQKLLAQIEIISIEPSEQGVKATISAVLTH